MDLLNKIFFSNVLIFNQLLITMYSIKEIIYFVCRELLLFKVRELFESQNLERKCTIQK